MDFYDWQKKWQKENPHAALYEAQLDAYLAGQEAANKSRTKRAYLKIKNLLCGAQADVCLRCGSQEFIGLPEDETILVCGDCGKRR